MTPEQKQIMDVIHDMSVRFQYDLEEVLLTIFHKLCVDCLTTDCVIEIAEQFRIENLEQKYLDRVGLLEDDEEDL